jgi:hypothetical protein
LYIYTSDYVAFNFCTTPVLIGWQANLFSVIVSKYISYASKPGKTGLNDRYGKLFGDVFTFHFLHSEVLVIIHHESGLRRNRELNKSGNAPRICVCPLPI